MNKEKSIKSSREFFGDIDEHVKLMDNELYAKHTNKFEVGTKLWIEVNVVESDMSSYLFKWLYSKSENGDAHIPFGCKLEKIHFSQPDVEEIKRKLIEFAESL